MTGNSNDDMKRALKNLGIPVSPGSLRLLTPLKNSSRTRNRDSAQPDNMSYFPTTPLARTRSVTPVTPRMSRMMPAIADHNVSHHMNKGSSDLGHARNYFNSARGTLYSRYSHNEWETSNKANFNLSEQQRSLGERIRADAFRAVKACDQKTKNRQASNTKRLRERYTDIMSLKDELIAEMRIIEGETDKLEEHRRVLDKAYQDTKGPLSIAEECLLQREKRIGIDLVHDDVEKSLSREVDVIKKCQDRMRRLLEKAHIQLKMNRAAQHACDKDAKDKFHAQNLDDRMQQMRNSSQGIGFHPGAETIDNTITIPYSWVKFTQENIARSQRERELSEKLRGEIDAALRQFANEMWSIFNGVNNSFQGRIQECNDAKNKLQAHLERTNNEIHDMERSIDLLKKAIYDKENPMKVAQTRLNDRTGRLHVELCNDPSMKGLQREVSEIRESVRILKEKLRAAENALVRLLKTRQALQNDIQVKENSLMIDSKYCMGMRKNMPMDPRVGPIFQMPLMPSF